MIVGDITTPPNTPEPMLPLTTCSLPPSPSISKFSLSHPPLTLLESPQCTSMRHLHQLHSHIIKTGLSRDPFAGSRLLNFCLTTTPTDLDYAILLFSHSPCTPTPFMYNSLIRALSKSSNPHLAISLFLEMCSNSQPQRLTFPSVFVAYAHMGLAREGAQLHGLVLKLGLDGDAYICNSMISMYATCGWIAEAWRLFDECRCFDLVPFNSMIMGLAKKGMIDDARRLFDEMPVRSPITWSAMISGYVRNRRNSESLGLFGRMQAEGIEPNEHTLVSLLGACACLGALEQGEWIHAYIRKEKSEENLIVSTAIVDMYCKCGSLDKARQVFENLRFKGLSTWNAMISGLAMHGRGREAIHLFSALEYSPLKPDYVSFIAILAACNHSAFVKEAWHYFKKMSRVYGTEPGIEHYGCMVDVLGRAGMVKEAEELIEKMSAEPDAIVWGSLLSACRNYGEMEIGKKAAMKILELDDCDSGGYVMLANGYADGGDFRGAVDTRAMMKGNGVRKEMGSSVIEVRGTAHEFLAGGMLHNQAGEICGLLNGLVMNMRAHNCDLRIND